MGKSQIKNICCIGAGYVGGPTMAVIADKCPNIQVNVVDINQDRINNWNNKDLSKLPIYEPGLREIIQRCRDKNLFFSTEIEEKIASAEMIFISVNTPTKTKGIGAGQASDLKWVEASSRQIAQYAKGHTVVVEKSTLPVKTAAVIKRILEASSENELSSNHSIQSFSVLSNPEFLSEGNAINDLEKPDRVLIGGSDKKAIAALSEIYLNWIAKEKIITTDLWSSELSKLVANAFLAQRISSINSVSSLCEATGADIKNVSLAIGTDRRIGKLFLNAGPGFGGSCFKKDISNLVYIYNSYGLHEEAAYWQKVIDINNWQQNRITEIILENLFGTITDKKISILGFSFKANTNDTRESPAIRICKNLLLEGCYLSIYDPQVKSEVIENDLDLAENEFLDKKAKLGTWRFSKTILESTYDADAVIVLTEWNEFKNIEWNKIIKNMRKPSWLFDTRSVTNIEKAKKAGMKTWRLGFNENKIY